MQKKIDSSKEVFLTHVFDAPREIVFGAWTDPKQLARWYAPKDCTIEFKKIDIREGGEFHSCIRTPEGHDCWCRGMYKEIITPERLVFTFAVSDEKGDFIDARQAGMDPDWPAETTVTVTFAEYEGKTKLTLHQTVSETLAIKTGAQPGWISMFECLAAELSGVRV